mmetsp:Transcript_13596/g.40245  ORF Transcript_13596/g.40245 Transcript_13596/m.40245 type:complete len:201 (-) Transcript_13596:189-791(-)
MRSAASTATTGATGRNHSRFLRPLRRSFIPRAGTARSERWPSARGPCSARPRTTPTTFSSARRSATSSTDTRVALSRAAYAPRSALSQGNGPACWRPPAVASGGGRNSHAEPMGRPQSPGAAGTCTGTSRRAASRSFASTFSAAPPLSATPSNRPGCRASRPETISTTRSSNARCAVRARARCAARSARAPFVSARSGNV